MLGFILGTMTGGVMGVFAMCLFIAGKREDEALERVPDETKGDH